MFPQMYICCYVPQACNKLVDLTNQNCLVLILSKGIATVFCFDTDSCSEWVSPSGVES